MKEIDENILNKLKASGLKITRARLGLLEVLRKNPLPLTEVELREKLSQVGIRVNKTTIYREFKHLRPLGLIREVDFGDGKKRYEFNSAHHHHIVCTNCKRVEEVIAENKMQRLEKEIGKHRDFKVTGHSLEFFGLCINCQ